MAAPEGSVTLPSIVPAFPSDCAGNTPATPSITTKQSRNFPINFHLNVEVVESRTDSHGRHRMPNERAEKTGERLYQFRTSRTFFACRLLTMNSCPLLSVTSQRWLLNMLIFRICSIFTRAFR